MHTAPVNTDSGCSELADMTSNRISIFGLGRVGLVTAVSFAKKGYQVIGIDPDKRKLKQIRKAEPPFVEPGLAEYLEAVTRNGALSVTNDPFTASGSDLVFIAVATPSNPDGSIDLTNVKDAATQIGQSYRRSRQAQLVVIKSTVTPGTARNVVKVTLRAQCGTDIAVCSNPEFLREGTALLDTEFPDRIVIGSDTQEAIDKLEEFYRRFYREKMPTVIATSHETAELIKYASNAFLATKVSFINTIGSIAERIPNVDVTTVARAMGLDQRIGPMFLQAGLGYGGSCLPKDLNAMLAFCRSLSYRSKLLEEVAQVNREQPTKAIEFAQRMLGSLHGRKIAILGLAFKPNTDDLRNAVSVPIVEGLLREGAAVCAYDPAAIATAKEIFGTRVQYAANARDCLREADLAILVTEWDEFKKLTGRDFTELMKTAMLFDGRRIYEPNSMRASGVTYGAIGLAG